MECHPSLYYLMYLGTLLFAVQVNVFINLLLFLFAVYYLFLLLMQQITNTVSLLKFQYNVQFSSVIFRKAFQGHYNK